jgi:DNA repair protein RecN (Recombination protein N)
VEAVVELPVGSAVPGMLEAAGVEGCEDGQLILKRVISAAGAGRQFVNGSACTLALLREIGDRLVDLHGPHDHQSLFSREAQTRLVDAFAGSVEVAVEYREARRGWLGLEAEQAESEAGAQAVEREIDLLDHQVGEIDAGELAADEEEPLVARQMAGGNAERLTLLAAEAGHALVGAEASLENGLMEVGRVAREMAKLDAVGAEGLATRVTALAEEVGDLAREFSVYGERIDSDPESLAAVEARLDLLENLKRKYGRTVADVLAFGEESRGRLAELRGRSERRANLGADIAKAREATLVAGRKLSKLRGTAAPKLAAEVRRHLQDLGFLKAGFEVRMDAVEGPGADGLETVEFVFAPNPGEPAQALRAIASSGEISRVMLALKTSLAAQDEVPVLVFDEIDANVGGEVAHAVAGKMAEIGGSRQVLCITHLPQVASAAGAHFVVAKSVVGGRTISALERVAEGGREDEIARMLGSRTGGAALAHAKELLDR